MFASPLSSRIAAIGPIVQLAYVPRDFDAAIRFWTQKLGVGPFYYLEHISAILDQLTYRGAPVTVDYSQAVSQWGDVQIELINQHDQAPSIFRDWDSDSLHHIQVAVSDYDVAVEMCKEQGFELAMECRGAKGVPGLKVGYFELGPGSPAGFLELLYFPDPAANHTTIRRIEEQVRIWDGRDPLRRIDTL
jgi:methylmalonyl-CoA/ethylmalonyl-CoA epimerase